MSTANFNVLHFSDPKVRTLHLAWIAFFITFFMWFCHVPLMPLIKDTFGLSMAEAKALLFLNVALTIPARTIVGSLVDKYGPRVMYSALLAISGCICFMFAWAQDYTQLAAARFLLGFAGAGFVIGIRLVTDWFPAKTAGAAQGIYGGWGNFGAAIANWALPAMSSVLIGYVGVAYSWRVAISIAGVVAIAYSFIFYMLVRNTPKGATYFAPKKVSAMEVSNKADFVLYMIMLSPIFLAMGIICWRLSPAQVGLLSEFVTYAIWAGLLLWFCWQAFGAYKLNAEAIREGVVGIHKYKFKQVALLDLSYAVTFGSEVAVVSMMPLMFSNEDTYAFSLAKASVMAGCFMAMNLIARPGGGWLSDKLGRKKTLMLTVAGSAIGYAGLSMMTPDWSLLAIGAVVVFCSFFVQAGAGATFGVVPTIKRRLTGQIAGMTGAYGNVGAALFLLVNSFYAPNVFFGVITGACIVVLGLLFLFMEEPKGQIAEVLPDGTVEMIDVG
ncbi:MFS transporter [Saccharophagus degradans]|uniref:MFS transporter n=1 Tax=Saccharophagus degradans TaxID=86304 RepID=UPI001C088D62|nr:MFS transporter [Saccharophagus degradans]MBU2985951.1 MFS transporter [Saccharophagus degradans]